MTDISDADLVKAAQDGDVSAVGDLYDRFQPRIYKYVRARVYDHHEAQDLTGEVFLLMVKNLSSYRVMGVPFSAWLYRIAHNLLVNHFQKENRTELVPIVFAENSHHRIGNPEVVLEHKFEMEWLLKGLEILENSQREVIILRFLAGLSLNEVAHILDKTVAAVKAIQHRGLLALKTALKYEYEAL